MAKELDLHDYDWLNLSEYPNIGYDNDNNLVEFSFNGNVNIRPYNTKLILSNLSKEEYKKCEEDMWYFFETYCFIHTQDHGKILIELRDYQKEFIDLIHNNNRIIGLMARQIGKTSSNALYIVWNLVFKKDWVALIVANEAELKYEIVSMIQDIYEALPPFLQTGVKKWNSGSIELNNGNKVKSAIAGKNAGRGKTPNYVLSDESAWYEETKAKAFFDSVKASLSSGSNNKFVMISTPNGRNIFFDYWDDAVKKKSNFVTYFANWKAVPGRDEEWKKNKIKEDNLTPIEWAQNHNCVFNGSSSTLLSGDTLVKLESLEPITKDYIYENVSLYREYNEESLYAITIDTSKTVGNDDPENDYICMNVLELKPNSIEQAVVFRTNNIHYKNIAQIVYDIGELYNFPLCVVEVNEGSGTYTANELLDNLDYPNMYFDPKKDGLEVGIKTTKGNRSIALKSLEKLISNDILNVIDNDTIFEFYNFIKVGKRYEASKGNTDDAVMSLAIFMYILMDSNNDLEITLDDYLEGEVQLINEDDTKDVDFMNSTIEQEENPSNWLLS